MQATKLREREGGRGKTLIGQKTKFLQQINCEEEMRKSIDRRVLRDISTNHMCTL